jgi:hypothetical protein
MSPTKRRADNALLTVENFTGIKEKRVLGILEYI